jgi:hypothetical protein
MKLINFCLILRVQHEYPDSQDVWDVHQRSIDRIECKIKKTLRKKNILRKMRGLDPQLSQLQLEEKYNKN